MKTISWNHGTIYNLKNHKFSRIRQGKKLKHVNKIISISEKTSESIKEIYPEYAKNIGNAAGLLLRAVPDATNTRINSTAIAA